MPKVTIQKQTDISAKDAFNKVSEMLEKDRELNKLDPGFKCEFDTTSLTGTAKGKQFTANLKVSGDDSSSAVEIIVELPFHLGLIKGVIEKTLQKKVDETLS